MLRSGICTPLRLLDVKVCVTASYLTTFETTSRIDGGLVLWSSLLPVDAWYILCI